MFTGIVETTGKIISLEKKGTNLRMSIASSITKELKIGQSVSHNGVCLTVESGGQGAGGKGQYTVTAVKETLQKTNFGSLKKGDSVNLERSLKIGDRLDGHFVQGHVDTTAICEEIKKEKGSWKFKFKVQSLKPETNRLLIEKGSVCINGVSLTLIDVQRSSFSVAIIPHTFNSTNFNSLQKGGIVNIEFDVLGKYIQKIIQK